MPDDRVASAGHAMAMLEHLLARRHSCRAFRPEPVDEGVIRRILAAAQRTPSWCNAQPWRVIITSGAATEALRAGLMEHVRSGERRPDIAFPEAYRGEYQDRRRECGYQLYDAVGVARGDREASARQAAENFRLFGAPHAALVTTEAALGTYGAVDCGAYITAFMLAAQALGVACVAQAALATYSPFLRTHFGIPESRKVVCGIAFGFEDASHPANAFRTSRAPTEEVVDWRS
jgi:nitroreductase